MKLISRTVNETLYDVLALNINTKEVRNIRVNVGSNTFSSDEKALAYIRAKHDTDAVKAVAIVNKSIASKLYVLTEEEFMRRAVAVADMKEARAYFKKTQGVEIEEEEG
ncbi:MAG: hypothetical protein IJH64_01650 [Oscillospiraceae bacterium]|nr:hypothetical protein [Oscillospiraceae bacterium]